MTRFIKPDRRTQDVPAAIRTLRVSLALAPNAGASILHVLAASSIAVQHQDHAPSGVHMQFPTALKAAERALP